MEALAPRMGEVEERASQAANGVEEIPVLAPVADRGEAKAEAEVEVRTGRIDEKAKMVC